MDKQEADKLVDELNELSEYWEQRKKRMIEISKILVSYYMWWQNKNKKH